MVASFRKFFLLPLYVHMVGGKGGCTFATVKCLLLLVIWQFFLCGFNFSCCWRHCIQISQIRVWSAQNDATSDNWVLPIIKCLPVCLEGEWSANDPPPPPCLNAYVMQVREMFLLRKSRGGGGSDLLDDCDYLLQWELSLTSPTEIW